MIEEDPDVEAYYKMGDDGDSLVPVSISLTLNFNQT